MHTPVLFNIHLSKAMAIVLSALAATALATGVTYADAPKPKETPTEVVVFEFGKLEPTYRIDGSQGPDVVVEGTLHIASQALLSHDGNLVGFTLHTNLSDAFAATVDGGESYIAVGASDGIPAECQSTACAPPFWKLTFRLVPEGGALLPNLLFDVTLRTQYAADGTLSEVCVVGQEGCDAGIP